MPRAEASDPPSSCDDKGVDDRATLALAPNLDGIEIGFRDVVALALHKVSESIEAVDEAANICAGPAAVGLQDGVPPDAGDHLLDIAVPQRQQAQREVAQNLDLHPTDAEGERQAEIRVACHAAEDFDATADMLLNEESSERDRWPHPLDACLHKVPGTRQLDLGTETRRDQTMVRFVGQVVRHRLQDD